MKIDVCLYHANCRDGLTAAWVVRKFAPDVQCLPVNYGEPPPDVRDKHVVIVDFSYPRATLCAMQASAASLLVLDHHKTAQEDLAGLDFAQFDMARSGAMLALDRFFPVGSGTRERLLPLVSYIQDRDLWTWRLPQSKQISAALDTYSLSWDLLDSISEDLLSDTDFHVLASEGQAVLRYQERLIDRIVESVQMKWVSMPSQRWCGMIEGTSVPAVNSIVLQSEVANRISAGHPFGVAYFLDKDGALHLSFRSRPEEPKAADVGAVAKLYGGGGHKHAAGARVTDKASIASWTGQ